MSQTTVFRRALLCALPVLCLPLGAQAGIAGNTLPANGSVVSGTATPSVSGSTLTLAVGSGATIIDWGTSGAIDPVSGAGGFDVGSQASVVLTGAGGGTPSSVLNIDTSGQPSQIDGKILGDNVNVFVANANGVFLGSGAVVSAPTVALLANGVSTAEALFSGGAFSASGMATGALNLASGAQIHANNVILAGNDAVNLGNAIQADTIDLYGEANITGSLNANTVSVSGGFYSTGTITANQLNVNLTGYVNDVKTGQILANNFTLDAGSTGTMNIRLTADGKQAQGFNVFINGNGSIDSGNTGNPSSARNINSRLIVQASGQLTAESDGHTFDVPGSSVSYPAFYFPGLIYLLGNHGLSVTAELDNAYTDSAPVGYGIFLLGPQVNDTFPIVANGDRGINIESTDYGPTVINGTSVTSGVEPLLPEFLFLESGSNGVATLSTPAPYTTAWTYDVPNDVFLASPSYSGPLYPVVQKKNASGSTFAPLNISPTALPENGRVVVGSASYTISSDSMAVSLSSSNGYVVILWGSSSGATLNPSAGQGGFDVGSKATVYFGYPTTANSGPGNVRGLLNVDISGRPSVIDGNLINEQYAKGHEFFANANGIFIGPNAIIQNYSVYNEIGFLTFPVNYQSFGSDSHFLDSLIQSPQSGSIVVYPGASFSEKTLFAGSSISYEASLPQLGDAIFVMTGISNSITLSGNLNANYGLGGSALSVEGLYSLNEKQGVDINLAGVLNISSAKVDLGGGNLNVYDVSGSGSIVMGSGAFLTVSNYAGPNSAILTAAQKSDPWNVDISGPDQE